MTKRIDRRTFLIGSAVLGGSAAIGYTALDRLGEHNDVVEREPTEGRPRPDDVDTGYGPLVRMADQRDVEVLALPAGFSYVTFGWTASPLKSVDGAHPRNHDGMGTFEGPDGTIRLIRNQENRNDRDDATRGVPAIDIPKYDPSAHGGTITLDFDPVSRTTVAEFPSIAGTHVNCAGGIAYRNAGWITSEETTATYEKPHGYNFFVPATGDGRQRDPQPIVAMGRFQHEAAAHDPRTGIVYETEDSGRSGFYRFVPDDPDNLLAGGTLQMLGIRGRRNYDTVRGQRRDERLDVEWHTIGDPDPGEAAPSVFDQGATAGGARFRRLEGIWWDGTRESFFFTSTAGGEAGYGQVWEYVPDRDPTQGGALYLRFESPGRSVLDSPDNVNVTPRGGILLCEDDTHEEDQETHPLAPGLGIVNRLIGIDATGRPFEFAVNVLNESELAGACWSPDGQILFVNVYGGSKRDSGMTCAIFPPAAGWGTGLL